MKQFWKIIGLKLLMRHLVFAICSLVSVSSLFSQMYTSADPYYLLLNEKAQFENGINFHSTTMRPYVKFNGKQLYLSIKNEFYINNSAPNQENMDVRYFGKGLGRFTSIHFAWLGKYFSFSAEPYILHSQNRNTNFIQRPEHYVFLNDAIQNKGNDYNRQGLRNAHFFLHYNGFGIGYSNENMWWGPGIQASLSMTNNTVGFPHYSIGTIKELRWRNWGFYGKYTFATIKENPIIGNTYYTALASSITYYSNPVISIGITRNFLTGGVNVGVPWSERDAANIIFQGFFIENLKSEKYTMDSGHDAFDQTISGFLSMMLPKSKMKLYLELGFNDNRQNFWDFVVQPDHALATIIGFQNYGIFNNNNLIFGFEYASLINSRMQVFRGFPPWYARSHYDDWSYEGRRWGAHSGSDSDDLIIFFGWMNDKWSFVPAFNYERHGVTTYRPAEIKMEIRVNTHYQFSNGLHVGVYYENQFEAHLGFPNDNYYFSEVTGKRQTKSIIIRLEKAIEF